MTPTGGLVVDDHTFMRASFRGCLTDLGLDPVMEAASLAEARRVLSHSVPLLAVVDLRLADGLAFELVGTLKRLGSRVVTITSADDGYSVRSAYAAGASGYLLKSASHDTVMTGLREVLAGRVYADPTVALLLVQGVQEAPLTDGTPLTDREVAVLRLVADGLTNVEIGSRLGIAPLSVKSHLARIGRKLGTGDRTQMVAAAMRSDVLR